MCLSARTRTYRVFLCVQFVPTLVLVVLSKLLPVKSTVRGVLQCKSEANTSPLSPLCSPCLCPPPLLLPSVLLLSSLLLFSFSSNQFPFCFSSCFSFFFIYISSFSSSLVSGYLLLGRTLFILWLLSTWKSHTADRCNCFPKDCFSQMRQFDHLGLFLTLALFFLFCPKSRV